jgi:hypothetical protein
MASYEGELKPLNLENRRAEQVQEDLRTRRADRRSRARSERQLSLVSAEVGARCETFAYSSLG